MTETTLILRAYYEAVYEMLESARDSLAERAGHLLKDEVGARGFEGFDGEKYQAYHDACVAFIDERIETFNPIGYQYTFDRSRATEAFELELQLNWYDARAEFEALAEAAAEKARSIMTDDDLRPVAAELIRQLGVFPNKSIIAAYHAKPALQKLPDYIAALAIEEIAR